MYRIMKIQYMTERRTVQKPTVSTVFASHNHHRHHHNWRHCSEFSVGTVEYVQRSLHNLFSSFA
jgi:hypothetical protein